MGIKMESKGLKRAASGAALAALLAGALLVALYLYGRANVEPLMVGSVLPEIPLSTRSGVPVSLHTRRSRQALLVFFRIDCPHCITELLHFSALQLTARDSLDFLFVSLSPPDETRDFFSTWRDDLPLVIADPGTAGKALGIMTLPLLLVVDDGGRVIYRRSGERSFETDEHLVHVVIRQRVL